MQSETIALDPLRKRFWFFVVLTVACFVLMRILTNGLSSEKIIEFEMAKNVEAAHAIMNTWTNESSSLFVKGIYADFLFIIGYAGLLFYGCRFLGALSGNYILRKAGYIFSFLAVIAGICDIIENIGMLVTIQSGAVNWVTHLTADMARVKFSLIAILLLYIVICLLFWVIEILVTNKRRTVL